MLTRSPGSCVLVFWSVNAAHSLTEAKCVCALSKVEGNPLFRHKTYNWHHLHSTYRQTHTTSTPLSRRLICVEVEVLTLSHRCNPSVRLRQDVNKAFKSTPHNDWAVSQAKTWICSTNKQQQCDWCTWSLFEVRLSTERQTDSQWFSPGRTAKCEILFKSSLLSLLTEVEQSDQAAWTLTSGDCMIISVCATICVSLPQRAFSSLFSVPDSSQFQITLLLTPDTINVSVY